MVLALATDTTEREALQGVPNVEKKDPYTEHKKDQNYTELIKAIIFSTLGECHSLYYQRYGLNQIKDDSEEWIKQDEFLEAKRSKIRRFISSLRMKLMLEHIELRPDKFKTFLRNVLRGKQIELAEKLLDQYNIHYRRGRKTAEQQAEKTAEDKRCPQCDFIGAVDTKFGYRKINGTTIPQSWCRKCRSKRGKRKNAQKKKTSRRKT